MSGKYTRIQLEDGWTMVRSHYGTNPHHYLQHIHDGEYYYVNHAHNSAPNAVYVSMVCTKCGERAPEEAVGFLKLCSWS